MPELVTRKKAIEKLADLILDSDGDHNESNLFFLCDILENGLGNYVPWSQRTNQELEDELNAEAGRDPEGDNRYEIVKE